jgi:monoamine oxidase
LEEEGLSEDYFFGGQHHTPAQVIEALRPLLDQIDADIARLDEEDDAVTEFDQMSIAQYLDQIGLTSGWLRDLLDVAFVTENGLSLEEQSALNFLWLAPVVENESALTMFGESDERYTVEGGSQRIIDELAARLEGQITTGQRLEAVSEDSSGTLNLTFTASNGSAIDVPADYVILAIPLTTLRQVDLSLDLPPLKQQAIHELSYGTNAKIVAGFERRLWYEQGYTGEVFTDEAYQLSWDNSVLQDIPQGGITFYSGGQPGVEIGNGSMEDHLTRLMEGFERTFPGVSALYNGNALRMHWPSYELSLGSYSCPTVGQYTTFFSAIPEPVGRLYFAGEHCSDAFWGFMNGGAESGRVAAEALLTALG